MSAPDWQRVKNIFALALKQPRERRPDFLNAACAGDPALRAEVESLLEADDAPESLFDNGKFGVAALFEADDGGYEGKEFGRYKVVQEIGRGGMGAVYLAARADDEYQKQVAVKIIKRGLDTDEVRRRFRNERQILARLEHPNIARLLDGGTTEDGSSYFVMEYVEGQALNEYANAHKLSTAERLKLFSTICSAVAYAHQNLVIHRDLKPSNILVTLDGTPKLLDFGIAKLLHGDGQGEGDPVTMTGLRVLTPEYASPEQVRGLPATTATDVYSLGVVLYELLTGYRPHRLTSRSPEEIARVICEQAPERPSAAFRAEGTGKPGDGETNESSSNVSPSPLHPVPPSQLRGDLDNIVLMAMRKEPARRYSSVAQFSDDIRRHLAGLPVLAHKDTFGYRTRKFIRRNKVAVSATALIMLTLLVGLAVSYRQYRNAQRERAKAEAVNEFLQTMLASSNPGSNVAGKPGRETTVNDVLDYAARRLETEDLSTQPEVKAQLQWIIGTSYLTQGRYDLAGKNLRAALEAQTKLFGDGSPETLKTLVPLASLLLVRADYAGAEKIYQQRLAILRTEHQRGRITADTVLIALNDFAVLRRALGNSREAETLLREALALSPQVPAEAQSNFRQVETVLTLTLLDQGKFDEAENYARKLVSEFRQMPNTETIEMCNGLTMLGSVLMEKGDLTEAERVLREAETLYRKLFDANFVAIYDNVRLQAQVLYLQGRPDEAEAKINQTLENYRRNSSPQYISYATALTVKGLILNKSGRSAEAEDILRTAVELRNQNLPKAHFMSALTKGALGEVLLNQKRFAEAEPLLLESYETLRLSQATENPRTLSAKRRLVEVYRAWNKPELLAKYQ